MKKKIIAYMLAFAGITVNLCAQPIWNGKSKTDQLFEANSGTLKHRFIIQLVNANSVTLQVSNRQQLDVLLSIDSILKAVQTDLAPLKDSLSNELTNKTIERVTYFDSKTRIRYKEHQPRGNSYINLKDGLAALKIEQDTLIIIGYTRNPHITKYSFGNWLPYKITVLINNVNEIEKIIDGNLNTAVAQIKTDWDSNKKWKDKGIFSRGLYAYYSIPYPAGNVPVRTTFPSGKFSVAPYVQVGLQNVSNIFTTSVGAGIILQGRSTPSSKMNFILMWEPYFFFDKKSDGHFKMRRNDFITAQYSTTFTVVTTRVEFSQSFTFSYLVNNSGNYFYDNTFKLGLPGAKYKDVTLRPEFIFNDLFKNFQPGLKLVLDLD